LVNDKHDKKMLERIVNATREMFSSWEFLDLKTLKRKRKLRLKRPLKIEFVQERI
jgi:hypothetical protein